MEEMTYIQAVARYAEIIGCTMKEATADAERKIKQDMEKRGATRKFAESTFIEDVEDMNPEEMDEMERKAKANKATNVHARKEPKENKEKKPRTVKENPTKVSLVSAIAEALTEQVERLEVVNKQQKIDVWIDNKYYSITITEHRQKKEG